MWYLQHKRESRRITCYSYAQLLREFYAQWRDPDGSIPWTMEHAE